MSLTIDQTKTTARAEQRAERVINRQIVREYRRALKDIRGELAELYERYAKNGELTLAEMTRYNRLSKMDRQIAKALGPRIRGVNQAIERLTESQYQEAWYRTAWSYDNALRTSLGWGQIPIEQVRAAVANPLREIATARLTNETRIRMNRAIRQGLIQGSSMPRMMRGVRDAIGVTTSEAMRIARTEAHRARELGSLEADMKAADKGVELMRVWDATLDSRTRPAHAALDGKQARPGEEFPGGPVAPGMWGEASQDINCRCSANKVIEGYEPQNRRVRYTDEERQRAQERENRRAAREGREPIRVGNSYVTKDYIDFTTWAKQRGVTRSRYGQEYDFL